jgi:hypothetical protein
MDAFPRSNLPSGLESDRFCDSPYRICGSVDHTRLIAPEQIASIEQQNVKHFLVFRIPTHEKPELLPCLFVVDRSMLILVIPPAVVIRRCPGVIIPCLPVIRYG